MAIKEPGRRLMANVKLAFVARKFAGHGRRPVQASLSLTSMIDFLVVTVVFLLMTFNASGETAHGTPPGAFHVNEIIDAPLVSLSGSQILLDGHAVGTTRTIEESRTIARIDELTTALAAKRAKWKLLFPEKPNPGVVVLQIDGDVPAVVVKSVFQTAALAGYPNVSFMVNALPKH